MNKKVVYSINMDRKTIYYGILNLGIDPSRIKNIDEKIEILIQTYYVREIKFKPFLNAKNKLIQLILEEGFPTVKQWNTIAKQQDYFSHRSLEYITNCNWKELERSLILEIKSMLLS